MATEEKKHTVQVTRKRLFTWVLVIVLIMGWMFILGVLVGRGTASLPINTRTVEKALEEDIKASAQKRQAEKNPPSDQDNDAERAELQFHEKLREAPPKIPYKITPTPAPVRRPAPTPAPQKQKPVEVARARATPKPAPKPTAAPKSEASAKTTSAASKTEQGRFSVQVSAFRDMGGADQLVATLRNKGYKAYHIRVDVPGKGRWFRVRVGAFEDRDAAEKMLDRLRNDNFKGIVVSTP